MKYLILFVCVLPMTAFADQCKTDKFYTPSLFQTVDEIMKADISSNDEEWVKNHKLLQYYETKCPEDKQFIALARYRYGESLSRSSSNKDKAFKVLAQSYQSYLEQKDIDGSLSVNSTHAKLLRELKKEKELSRLIQTTVADCESKLKTSCFYLYQKNTSRSRFVEGEARFN